MRLFSLAFLFGILILQQFSYLPAKQWVWVILIICLATVYWKPCRLPIACALGFAWVLWYAHYQMSWTVPNELEGKNITITGYIASIPNSSQQMTEFLFSLKTVEHNNKIESGHGVVHLSWHENPRLPTSMLMLHAGDEWKFSVHLKKVHGTMNPGGFDYEAHAFTEGIRANGYIILKADNKLLSSHWYHSPLNRIREFLKNRIEKNLPSSLTSPWITALIIGERNGISEESWEILRNTGTNHLMAIAGLHIGFMSGFIYALVVWCWRRQKKLALLLPAQHAGALAALQMALMYSALAGFSIPTQRACIMLCVFLIVGLYRRNRLAWHAWSVALILVLLINPLSVLTESFWLSFGAVAFIIYGVGGRLAPTGWWWKWGRIQWVIAIGLIPFSIWLFQQVSIVSFLANSIAIPWVGFLLVPLCLLGTFLLLFSEKIGGFILFFADKVLSLLWKILTWLAHLSWGSWYQIMPNHFILIAACLGIIFLLLPKGFPGRYFGIIGLLPLFFYQAPKPQTGEVNFALLDVGQGLATVVQTKNHVLIFDTGAKLSGNFDMGESVVVPYLRTLGVKHVDMLVVSHGDNDHIGGAQAILRRFPVFAIKTSVPKEFSHPMTTYCLQGESWRWDDVMFEFLYPTKNKLGFNNDSSCVLRISTQNKHVLLTGDIEEYAEKYLVDTELKNLSADILVAPHHGSKTSAVNAFLEAVKPTYVLFPVGYRNRYHFPHQIVIEKFERLKAIKVDTAQAGAIIFKLEKKPISAPICYRMQHKHYWNI